MSFSMYRRFSLAGFGFHVAALVLLDVSARAQGAREIIIQRVLVDEQPHKEKKEEADDDDDDRPAYWIGIALEGAEGQQGLTVADVLPESPALQAGLKAGDVLAAVGEKKLERLEQLIDLIQDSGGKPLELHVVRDSKETTVHVKPGKRPTESPRRSQGKEEASAATHVPVAPPWAWVPDPQRPNAQPRTARIAVAFPSPQLPEDMEVTISKKGNKPAVVVAKQGDKLWRTTENELGMLPPSAQAYAAKMLGMDVRGRMPGGGPPGMMPGMGGMMMPGMPAMGGIPGMPGPPAMSIGGLDPAREMQRMEFRLDKDGKTPHLKVGSSGGIQVEIREVEKKEGKVEKNENKSVKPAAEKQDPDRTRRIRQLQEEAERLRDRLNKLKEERG